MVKNVNREKLYVSCHGGSVEKNPKTVTVVRKCPRSVNPEDDAVYDVGSTHGAVGKPIYVVPRGVR